MNKPGRFCLDWHPGPGAQLELISSPHSPGQGKSSKERIYQLKYTSPLRPTIRTIQELPLTQGDLDAVDQKIDELVKAVNARAVGSAVSPSPATASPQDPEFQMLGDLLFSLVFVAPYMSADLRKPKSFVEVGIDEDLLGYPWELMHDGNDFLCLRHYVGRFINSTTSNPPTTQSADLWGESFETLSVLVIAVPNPMPRNKVNYPKLSSAEPEAVAIVDALTKLEGVDVKILKGNDATHMKVFQALKKKAYHIVHYCGHAEIDNNSPNQSCLVLHDQSMTTRSLTTFVGKAKPILCFINGCETAQAGSAKQSFNFYGLARAFLETGAYLLGSRWKINDELAAEFAPAFYRSLLGQGNPLGQAVLDARQACYKMDPGNFAWASYVLYGDPRVCFRRLPAEAEPGPKTTTSLPEAVVN
ncbi:MAG TPA: CHAT domain-containing protein [Isosphaeraceae bacterium]|nr:CHAT domain-containing protein [Isosphaeraceae bacterium]